MNVVEIFNEGFAVMCVGMGTVFVFLTIMIFAMNCMSKVVAKLNTIWPEPVPQVAGSKKKVAKGDDSEIAAAIVAAMFKR